MTMETSPPRSTIGRSPWRDRTLLRNDLLFDFPLPATALVERTARTKIAGHVFAIASEANLLQLTRIARAGRSCAGDAQAVAFLEARLSRA